MKKTKEKIIKKNASNTICKPLSDNNLLYSNAEQYRIITGTSMDGFWAVDMEGGHFKDVNEAFSRMIGYSRDELLSMSVPDIVTVETPAEIQEHIRKIIKTGSDFFEWQFRCKDGRIIDVEVSATYYSQLKQLLIFQRDITKRKQAEEALRASEERYRQLVETVTDYIYTVKIENGRPVASAHSPGCIAVTGYSAEEYESDPYLWYKMIHKDDREAVTEQTAAIFLKREAFPLEHRIIHKDGKVRWVRNMPVPIYENDTLVSCDGLISDITERKYAEEALHISKEKYRNIFERAIEGIFQCSFEGKFISVNPSFAKMLRYESPDDLIANIRSIRNQLFIHPEESSSFLVALKQAGTLFGFEHQFYRKDGTKIWISSNVNLIRNSNGKSLYIEGTSIDITERKQAEEEREKLQSQLRQAQKMEAIGTFVGGIAHDFNNILSIIIGYATLLQMELDENTELHSYADLILSSSEKAANLTKGLLAFSRKQPMNLRPLKLNEHIKGTEKILKRLLTEDIVFKKILTKENTTIIGDTTQIDQILFNLVTNARDAMPKGGKLIIETALAVFDKEFPSLIGIGKPGKYILITVSDTGAGIDEKTREHIFDPFFTTKEVGKGTGLGLSTVYGIVKQLNGYINVISMPGMGTSFNIFFPVASGPVKEKKSAARKIKKGHEKIIIAEDNEQVRLLVKKILGKYGYAIVEAVDGEDAVEKFRKNSNADLLIIDSVMPKKNGRDIYNEIIKIKPGVKTLFTSGYTRDVILDKGIEDKEFDFISKPITPAKLLNKVREILDRERLKN
ncbi:MAG: PAS domain S-box protein [Spirochaetota bacterium]